MSTYRQALPQLSDRVFLTDGGIETTLIYRFFALNLGAGVAAGRHAGESKRLKGPGALHDASMCCQEASAVVLRR